MPFTKQNIDKLERTDNGVVYRDVVRYVTHIGSKGDDGADTFNVFITPNAHVFEATSEHATVATDRIVVLAFRGGIQLDTTVGAISGAIPSALAATVQNNGTNQTYIDVAVTESLTQNSGTLEIPITYNINVKDSSTVYNTEYWDASLGYEYATTTVTYSWALVKEGAPGPAGLRGATLRGPVDYATQSGPPRRWCNGVANADYAEDALWIDIAYSDGKYYYCSTSYTDAANDDWSAVSANWTEADRQFQFIASKLLLVQNAKIDFLSTNGLRLIDDNSNVVGGAQGGSGVNFWAGSESPLNAPFQVNCQGNITAKSGTFAGYVQMPYVFIADLGHNANGWLADSRANLIANGLAGTYGMGDGGVLLLPEPSVELNGMTYNIIVEPNIATKTAGETPGISIRTVNGTTTLGIYAFFNSLGPYDLIAFYGGRVQVTCIPVYHTPIMYYWVVTICTSSCDAYESGNVEHYGQITSDNNICRIVKVSSLPTNPASDTIYIV